MSEGVDYAWSRPRPWILAASGKTFALRYAGPGSSGKHMSRPEVDALAAAGLWLGTLAEGSERDALLGRQKGMDHARSAKDMAMRAGMPEDGVIFFAVDFDATAAELARCTPYFDGCANAIGFSRVGIYGGWRTIEWATKGGHAAKCFQTYAWSGGRVHPRADVLQYHNRATIDGGQVDLCRSITARWGQWRPGVETVGSAPDAIPPASTTEPWDYAPTVDAAGRTFDTLAEQLEGSSRAIEAGFSG